MEDRRTRSIARYANALTGRANTDSAVSERDINIAF